MTNEQQIELRKKLDTLLYNSDVKATSKKGREMSVAFWAGVLNYAVMQDANDPTVSLLGLLIMSGRVDEIGRGTTH